MASNYEAVVNALKAGQGPPESEFLGNDTAAPEAESPEEDKGEEVGLGEILEVLTAILGTLQGQTRPMPSGAQGSY